MLAPLPSVMVTVGNMEKNNILTVAWCGILSTNPARLYISVRPTRHSYAALVESGEFVVNLTTERLVRATDFVGIYTGAKMDKFEKCGLTRIPSSKVAPPTVMESPVAIECKVFNTLESGTHTVFMADVLNVSCDEELLDKDGKICLDRAGLVAYAHGEYFSLGKRLGKFGFSATKKKKKPQGRGRKS